MSVRHYPTMQDALRAGRKIGQEANVKRPSDKDSIPRVANAEGEIIDSGPNSIRETNRTLIDFFPWSEVDIYKSCQCRFQRFGSGKSIAIGQHPRRHLEVIVDMLTDFLVHELVLGHRQRHNSVWVGDWVVLVCEGMQDKFEGPVRLEVVSCTS